MKSEINEAFVGSPPRDIAENPHFSFSFPCYEKLIRRIKVDTLVSEFTWWNTSKRLLCWYIVYFRRVTLIKRPKTSHKHEKMQCQHATQKSEMRVLGQRYKEWHRVNEPEKSLWFKSSQMSQKWRSYLRNSLRYSRVCKGAYTSEPSHNQSDRWFVCTYFANIRVNL